MNINENTNSKEIKSNSQEGLNQELQSASNKDKEIDLKNTDSDYNLGWNKYSETTNGRFAMIGFFAILLIELFTHQSFLNWAGILN